MWMSPSFSHSLSQPIDQCKSKPVTLGHDILWLDFKCVYRSESFCTCRQKHWGHSLTRSARRFQLHVCICQRPLSFALHENNERHWEWKTTVVWMADIHYYYISKYWSCLDCFCLQVYTILASPAQNIQILICARSYLRRIIVGSECFLYSLVSRLAQLAVSFKVRTQTQTP